MPLGVVVGRGIATCIRYTTVWRDISPREIATAETGMVRRQARSAEYRVCFIAPTGWSTAWPTRASGRRWLHRRAAVDFVSIGA